MTIETTLPVTTLTNTQSPRPLDHQLVQALNANAYALMQAQRLIAALSQDVSRLESIVSQDPEK